MRKSIRFRLVPVAAGVCLLLVLSFGGAAFASSKPGTHPHISGSEYVTSDIIGCAVVTIHGSNFFPSTTTTINQANIYVAASNSGASGSVQSFFTPVDTHGSFTTYYGVCGVGGSNDWFQLGGVDTTTFYYTNFMLTISNGKTGPAPLPHISSSEHVYSSGGCANVTVSGTNFVPTTDPNNPNVAYVAVFASSDFQANATVYPPIDSSGSFSATFQVCGLGLAHDLIEIGSEDISSFLYANVVYTISD